MTLSFIGKPVHIIRKDDVIGKYIGHTDAMTRLALNEGLGKVIFIEHTEHKDQFVREFDIIVDKFIFDNPGTHVVFVKLDLLRLPAVICSIRMMHHQATPKPNKLSLSLSLSL